MLEQPESLKYKKSITEIAPQRIRVVLPGLEQELGLLSAYVVSETTLADLGTVNQQSILDMDEPAIATYLNNVLKLLQNGTETPESLLQHSMFRAVVTHALRLQQ